MPGSPRTRVGLLLLVPVVVGSAGCLAASLASRGAPANQVKTLSFEMAPVNLPAKSPGTFQPTPHFVEIPMDGWIHGFKTELVDGNGRPVPHELLHHVQVMFPAKRELLYPLMRRLVGAGSETGQMALPTQVGVRVNRGDTLLMAAMLDNHTSTSYRNVHVKVDLTYTTPGSWRPPLDVIPFFDQVTPILQKTYWNLPSGPSEKHIAVVFPVSGRILGIGGHIHRWGTSLSLTDPSTNDTLWSAKPVQRPDGSIETVPHRSFVWSGGRRVKANHPYRFTVRFDNPGAPIPDGAMGTLGGVFIPDGPLPPVDRTDPVYRWDWSRNAAPPKDGGEGHAHR